LFKEIPFKPVPMLDFLLWVILIYFALLLFWRYVLPFLLKRYMRKMQQKFTRYHDERFEKESSRREGEVNIDHIPEPSEKDNRHIDESDYVDFEEIKDKDPNN
jgi:hypothetical protein